MSGCGPAQPALADPAKGQVGEMISRGPYQPRPCCDSVIFSCNTHSLSSNNILSKCFENSKLLLPLILHSPRFRSILRHAAFLKCNLCCRYIRYFNALKSHQEFGEG